MGVVFDQDAIAAVLHHCSTGGHHSGLVIAMLCAACIVQFAGEASAQCSARDVLQNQLKFKEAPSATR